MTDLLELFSRDPRKLSRDDISAIIAKMRESRSQFNLGNMKAGKAPKAPAAPKTAAGKAAASLNLKLDLSSLGSKK